MVIDINENIKQFVFRECTDFNEAVIHPICKLLYKRVLEIENEEIARKEVLSLYNDALWVACQDSLGLLQIDLSVITIDVNSKYYNSEWLSAFLFTAGRICVSDDYWINHQEMKILVFEFEKLLDSDFFYINDWGFPEDICPVKYAPISQWINLGNYDWEELTGFYNLELLDQLYSVAQNDSERRLVYRTIMNDAIITYSNILKEEEVYLWLCKIKVDLLERGADLNLEDRTKCEEEVLNIKRGNITMNVALLRKYLKKLVKWNDIPTDARKGYIWYAVWLFFKKNGMLKVNSQSAFSRLMKEWFPNCNYGKADQMRIYNSVYLETNRWQVWKYVEFKRKASPKVSERGFNRIRDLYKILESRVQIDYVWQEKI